MPTISVLSWNAYGGNIGNLATAIQSLAIDFTVIQEAHNTNNTNWYNPLTALVGYTVVQCISENAIRTTPTGQNIAYDPNLRRSYAYVYRNASIGALNHGLVDYTADAAYANIVPNSAFSAGQQGYGLRPPLRITFTHNGANTVYFYTWHAPLLHSNTTGLTMFSNCNTLATDEGTGDLVIIGADMNNTNINAYFNNFGGIQDHYDTVIAANTTGAGVVDTRTVGGTTPLQITQLNALYVAPHWAIPANITY